MEFKVEEVFVCVFLCSYTSIYFFMYVLKDIPSKRCYFERFYVYWSVLFYEKILDTSVVTSALTLFVEFGTSLTDSHIHPKLNWVLNEILERM